MDKIYKKIINTMLKAGKRIRKKAGKIEDIGVAKKYLTEEDLRIERELKKIISTNFPNHEYFSEEENFNFVDAKDVWVCDPISGTATFIKGLAHYGMAMAHVHNREVVFSVVYDPSVDELYTAYKNKGAFLNGKKLQIQQNDDDRPNVLFLLSKNWKNINQSKEMFKKLAGFKLYRTWNSQAVSYCHVARGIYNGMVCFSKDSFPDFAGSLIVKEAGGKFTNYKNEIEPKPEDRIFVCGDDKTYKLIEPLVKEVIM